MANTKIQSEQIQDGAITAAKIADGAIVASEVADNAITTAKINADAVTGAKIADNAIDSEHYTDGSIDTAHIADAQITVGKMAANSVDSDQYVDGSIDTAHIADAQVTTAKITDGNISTAKIADNAVTSAKIDTNIDIAGTFDVTGAATFDSNITMSNASSPTILMTDTTNTLSLKMFSGNTTANIGTTTNHPLTFFSNDAERMRIDMVGTTTITGTNTYNYIKLVDSGGTLDGSVYADGQSIGFLDADDNWSIECAKDSHTTFKINNSEKMHINSTGVGIGIAAENAYTSYTALEISRSGSIYANNTADDFNIGNNFYLGSGGNWKAKNTEAATIMQFDNGNFNFFTAASTTADNNINWSQKVQIQNAGGISFNGDTAAANALDDYEEGIWTPTIGGWNNTTVKTPDSQNGGRYTKIGSLVTVSANITWSGTETLSGGIIIRGLPYSANSTAGYRAAGSIAGFTGVTGNNNYEYFTLGMDAGNNYLYLIQARDNSYSHSPTISNAGAIYGITFSYHV